MHSETDILDQTDEEMAFSSQQEILEHTFLKLKNGLFAIPVQTVREFLEVQQFIYIPEAPPYVLGLITVRDENVAVVDLAMKLGMPAIEHTKDTRIIVMEVPKAYGHSVIGALVDSVVDVCIPEETDGCTVPDLGGNLTLNYITKLARYNNKTVIILDIEQIFKDRILHIGEPNVPT